jgi:putative Ca2+/H+ antiporter (TMEM165/GDT1 family)
MTSTLLVAERSRRVDILWGFLTAAFALALVRGHIGAATAAGRTVVDLVFGALLVIAVGAWIWFRRHPARLEITPEAVLFSHRGQRRGTRLPAPGELYVHTTFIGATDRLRFLKVTGSEEAIPMTMFDDAEVTAACRASGWRFVGDP